MAAVAESSPLAEEVKTATKDPSTREKWIQYCAIFGQGVKDPSKHPDKFLAGFLAGLEATAADSAQIFVGGLAPDTTEEIVKEYFSKWGEVTRMEMKIPKGFGFVTFSSTEAVDSIMANHASHQINGKFIDCKKAENRRNQIGAPVVQGGFSKGIGKGVKGFPMASNILQPRYTGIRPGQFPVAIPRQPPQIHLQRGRFAPQFQATPQQLPFNNNIKGKGRGIPPTRPTGPADECQIFIGGVPIDCADETIAEYFSKWGEVARIEMKTGKGFGFVTFTSPEPIDSIMANHDSHTINGKFVDCKRAENRRKTAQDFGAPTVPGKVTYAPVRQPTFSPLRATPFA